ncbi:MAG: von Willebrand factor type A domain-containing protein [Myxococcales bacterium]
MEANAKKTSKRNLVAWLGVLGGFLCSIVVVTLVFGQNIRALFAASSNALGGSSYENANVSNAGSAGYNFASKRKAIQNFGSNGYVARPPTPSLVPSRDSSGESYAHVAESSFLTTTANPLSTFAADVDTASYSNVRSYLNLNQLPPADAVRIEELVNYFSYDYPAPQQDAFAAHIEVARAPWNTSHYLARIGLKAREIPKGERPQSNLVFLVDVSGSMGVPNKLPLLKKAFRMLVDQLDERDSVSLVKYADGTGVALQPTRGDHRSAILSAIDELGAGGSTNGAGGIELAYQVAAQNFRKGGVNRVILATDGDFNVGVSSEGGLETLIQEKAKTGVFLTVLGFGMGNYKDSKVETLADKGKGNYAYIDTENEARKVLVEQMQLDARHRRQGRQAPGRVQPGARRVLPAPRLREPRDEGRGLQGRQEGRRRRRGRARGYRAVRAGPRRSGRGHQRAQVPEGARADRGRRERGAVLAEDPLQAPRGRDQPRARLPGAHERDQRDVRRDDLRRQRGLVRDAAARLEGEGRVDLRAGALTRPEGDRAGRERLPPGVPGARAQGEPGPKGPCAGGRLQRERGVAAQMPTAVCGRS